MDYELLSFIKRSERRKQILKELTTPKTPTEIAEEVGVSVSHVSRTLKQFEEREIAECKTPNAKTGRIYTLKNSGEKILEIIEE